MSSVELDSIGSPADELFYKGRLFPLHVPLRTQMVEKLEKMVCSQIRSSQQNVWKAYPGTLAEPQTLEIRRIFLDIVPVLIEIARNEGLRLIASARMLFLIRIFLAIVPVLTEVARN
jgi:hypothetical protein